MLLLTRIQDSSISRNNQNNPMNIGSTSQRQYVYFFFLRLIINLFARYMLCRSKEKELSLKTIRHRLNSVSGDANEENYIHGNCESTIHPGKERSPSSPTREHSTFGTLFSPNGKGKGEGEEDGSAVPGVWLTVSMHSTFEKVKVRGLMILNYTRS